MLALTTIPVQAAPNISDYCLTQDIERPKPAAYDNDIPPVIVNFAVKGKNYRVISGKGGHPSSLVTLEYEKGNEISRFDSLQNQFLFDGSVTDMAISKDGWLWMDGDLEDYIAYIDFNTFPLAITQARELSDITDTKCPPLTSILGCKVTQGIYSHTLERVFVSTIKPSILSLFKRVNLDIVNGKARPLPEEMNKIYVKTPFSSTEPPHFNDVLLPHGVFISDADGKALFYDGEKVTSLLSPKIYGESPQWRRTISPVSKQLFLSIKKEIGADLVRVHADLTLSLISKPDAINNASFTINEFPRMQLFFWRSSSRARYSLSIELSGKLHPIFIATEPWFIGNLKYHKDDLDTVYFRVTNSEVNSFVDYFIVKATESIQCIKRLSLDSPFIL